MEKFCYRCGALERDDGPLIEGLCQRCFTAEVPLLRVPKKIRVLWCKNCGAYFSQGRWIPRSPGSSREEIIRELVLQSVGVTRLSSAGEELIPAVQSSDVEFDIRPDLEKSVVWVEGKGKIHELQTEPKHEKTSVGLEVEYRTCKFCSLKRGGYHEAIVQIRGDFDDCELSEFRGALESLATEEGKDFVTGVEMVKGGMNVYVGSLALGRKMAAFLKRSGATIDESSKLVGQSKNGKRRYRVTILAKFAGGSPKRG